MGIYKIKTGKNKGKYRVLSYVTGKWHKTPYNTYTDALKRAGHIARRKYLKKKRK
tara:strand:+ start:1662 stop:1826 length:165 start_codon:yes stop_codon:yes gene_type:complete